MIGFNCALFLLGLEHSSIFFLLLLYGNTSHLDYSKVMHTWRLSCMKILYIAIFKNHLRYHSYYFVRKTTALVFLYVRLAFGVRMKRPNRIQRPFSTKTFWYMKSCTEYQPVCTQ